MRELSKVVTVSVGHVSELSQDDQQLLQCALHARLYAYAPYSNYLVGAAVRSTQGDIYSGCNVERCSFTQTTHAEQNAIDSMIAHTRQAHIAAIAIVAAPAEQRIHMNPDTPHEQYILEQISLMCGHCLQIMWEHCGSNPQVKIIGLQRDGWVVVTTVADMLPIPFGPAQVKEK